MYLIQRIRELSKKREEILNPIENPLSYTLNQAVRIVDESHGLPSQLISRSIQNANLTYGPFVVEDVVYFSDQPLVFLVNEDNEETLPDDTANKLHDISDRFNLVVKHTFQTWYFEERRFRFFPRYVAEVSDYGVIAINPKYRRAAELFEDLSRELHGVML